ncbi:MAG: hypothetical protein K0Q49_49 [Haloplasmataceae bacterium]|nr:hypothetical protein [Haloplasmataceae bacterium]
MKKVLSFIAILVIGLALVGCKKDTTTGSTTATTNAKDTIKPLLDVAPKDVTIMFGDDYDFMTGVEATDNKDGNINSSVTIEKGTYNNQTPGQYVITYKVKDSDGNEQTATRNVTVLEKTSAIVIDGQKYAMAYNPILNPKTLMGNEPFSWHFDLTKVSVFSKDYFDFLYANYSDRLYSGWTNIAVTNGDDEIVLLRDHTCNEYSEAGTEVCTLNNKWSNGTVINDYQNVYGGFGSIIVPEGGHVIVFINDGANGAGSPRAFGDLLMLGGSGLGKEVKFQDPEIVVNLSTNELPKIVIPETNYIKKIKINEAFDLMTGVTVTDKETTNVTLTTKIYKLNGTVYEEADAISTAEVGTYAIEYYAPYDGTNQIFARRQVIVELDTVVETKYLTLGDDQVPVTLNPASWTAPNVHVYTKEFWDANYSSFSPNYYQWAVVAVTDNFGRIIELRSSWGQPFSHYTVEHPFGVTPDLSVWGNINTTNWSIDMITNLTVPEGGFVVGFGHASSTNEWRVWAYKHLLTNVDFEVNETADPQAKVDLNLSPIGVQFEGEWFDNSITFGGKDVAVDFNTPNWPTYYNIKNGQLYTKTFWDAIDQTQLVSINEGFMYQNGFIIVYNQFGKVVEIRDDNNFKEFTVANPTGAVPTTWVKGKPTQDLVVPENGFVLGLWLPSASTQTEIYQAFVHTSGVPSTAAGTTDVNPIGKKAEGKWFTSSISLGGKDVAVDYNTTSWPTYYSIVNAQLFTKEFWDAIDQTQLVSINEGFMYQNGVIIVFDQDGKVIEIRDDHNGKEFTVANPTGAVPTTWVKGKPTQGLVVPDGGFVIGMWLGNVNSKYDLYEAFIHTSGIPATAAGTTDVNAIGKTAESKWFSQDVVEPVANHVKYDDTEFLVTFNPANYDVYYTLPNAHLYNKAFWDAIDQSTLVSVTEGNMYQYSFLVVIDSTGKIVEIRDGLAETATHFTEANPAGIAATFTRLTPTKDLVVPENGYVLAFTAINGDSTLRTAGYKAFVHTSGSHIVGTTPRTTDINPIGTNLEIVINN